jgi:hypothetical protein
MRFKAEQLLEFVINNIGLDRDLIVEKAGYIGNDGKLQFSGFYEEFTKNSLGFPEDREDDWGAVSDFLHEKGGGCSPMILDGKIVGRHGIRISDVARDHDWEEVDWDDIQEEAGEFHLDSPYEVQVSTSAELRCFNNYSLEDACDEFSGDFTDLLRSSYDHLGDDENGQQLDHFLEQNEEHPRHYINIAKRLGWFTRDLP